jgi:hypothetical protein
MAREVATESRTLQYIAVPSWLLLSHAFHNRCSPCSKVRSAISPANAVAARIESSAVPQRTTTCTVMGRAHSMQGARTAAWCT